MMIQLPEKVKYIINRIMEAGHEAYAVGGCIRDSILGRRPDDWDITTSASPEQVKGLFDHTIDTGIQHGTVTVMIGKEGFEVTTYRIDGKYEDGRHPSEVMFTPNLTEDLKRRDFTMNAMAYNDRSGLVDVFGGIDDIRRKIIRCVGEPKERFKEDALRMMRAVRFSGQLGYEIEANTSKAIKELSHNLIRVSAERIQTELIKLAISPHPENLRLAWETGITQVILPEFDVCMATEQNNPHHCYNVGEHILKSMEAIRPEKVLRLAMLFHDIGKPGAITADEAGIHHFYGHPALAAQMAKGILRRLKFDNQTIYFVTGLVKYHDYDVKPASGSVRRAIMKTGEDIFPLLFEVKAADIKAQSTFMREEKEDALKAVYKVYQQVVSEKQCVSLKGLAVTGKDLIEETGMQAGPELGVMLKKLLDFVVEDPSRNEREVLLKAAKEFK